MIDHTHADETDSRLDQLLQRWEELRAQGQSLSPEQLCSTCPELAGELARRIALLRRLDPLLEETRTFPTGPAAADPAGGSSRQAAAAHAEYCDLHFHASGALGEVFRARNAELNREVALKFLKPGRARDPESRRRFLQEAEVTGRLEHPGIVPIYALGSDSAGAPCYAMRFIRGATLQDALDGFHAAEQPDRDPSERSLALRELLNRFVSICNTVAYAHSRGILHRDLKPRNVMLGRYEETLVVDWGLAKPFPREGAAGGAGEEPLTPSSGSGAETPTVGVVGTPAYMSPEQAAADWDVVGPASDLFSLGAILYAILTGQAPYGGHGRGAILEQVKRCAFPTPRQVKPGVPRALEAICLKAMAARPGDRYATALELAAEVKRWLADEPVAAYAEPIRLRVQRWMRRHRAPVTSAAAVLVFSVVGLAGFATVLAGKNRELDRQRARAERREALALDAVKKFRDAVQANDELRNRTDLERLRKALLQEPLEFFGQLRDQLQADRDTRPAALARLAAANLDLAHTTQEIGNLPDAIRAYREELALRQRLARDHPTVAAHWRDLAASHNNLGYLRFLTGRRAEALESLRRGLEILERLVDDHPDVGQYPMDLAECHTKIGNVLCEMGQPAEALDAYRRAREIQDRLVKDHPGVAQYRSHLAHSFYFIGYLLGVMGRPAEALESHRRALKIQEQLVRDDSTVVEYQSRLASSHYYIGSLLDLTGQPAEALESHQQALPIRQRLARANPTVTEHQRHLAESHDFIGYLLGITGRPAEALESHRRALEIFEHLVRNDRTVPLYHRALALSHFHIGYLLGVTGQPAEALEAHGRALEIFERLAREHPSVHTYQNDVGDTLNYIAEIEMGQGRWHEARQHLERAIERQRAALTAMPDWSSYQRALKHDLLNLAKAYQALNQPTEAVRVARELAELARGDPTELYGAACALALSVPLTRGAPQRILAAEAVRMLRAAMAAGWDDAQHTSRDPGLVPLHDREDFRQVLAELFDRTFPADHPFAW
jgi:serine/threonine-protein kinase